MTVRRLASAVIVVVALGLWWLTASWLADGVDRHLEAHALALSVTGDVEGLRATHPALRVELSGQDGDTPGLRTVAGERVLTMAGEEGVVTLARDLGESRLLLAGYSVLLALVAGLAVTLLLRGGGAAARAGADQERRLEDFAHDLRNPLTGLRINAELLLSLYRDGQPRALPPEEHRALERDVLTQLDEFSGLIDDLVDRRGENSDPVRFDSLVETACEWVRCRRGDVEIRTETTPWLVHGDGGALGRGVSNLVDNAVKWSPADGQVRVRLTRDDDARRAVLTVADSGPGVAPGERDRVFDRFYRSPDVGDTPGEGLGLTIAKEAVEEAGGHVSVGDSGDGGALFTVVLPGSAG